MIFHLLQRRESLFEIWITEKVFSSCSSEQEIGRRLSLITRLLKLLFNLLNRLIHYLIRRRLLILLLSLTFYNTFTKL